MCGGEGEVDKGFFCRLLFSVRRLKRNTQRGERKESSGRLMTEWFFSFFHRDTIDPKRGLAPL